MTPTINAIRREMRTMENEGAPAVRIRVTTAVWETIEREAAPTLHSTTTQADRLLGIPVQKESVGSLDAPGWQLMSI